MLTACEDLTLAVNAMRIGARDYILKPFRLSEITVSVQEALERRRNKIEQAERMALLEETVNERTVELRKLLDRLHDASEITLEALVAALDAREHETQAHSKRVSEYTLYLAREMSVDASQLEIVRRGAMLHDIGKIGISDSILLKPSKLTNEEWVDMQKHPQIGYWILHGIEALNPASEVVLSHHEKYDGTGYPRKLNAASIPLGARIFSVTDCLDVVTSDRPYRKASSYEDARAEISQFSGIQFDPDVVRYFLQVPLHVWTDIRQMTARASTRSRLDLNNPSTFLREYLGCPIVPSPARTAAFEILMQVHSGGYAADLLYARTLDFDSRDAGLAAEITLGVLKSSYRNWIF